jgi:hypothetical protein
MCSAGLLPLEWEESATGKVLSKSILIEVSICAIGSNPDALAVRLYDEGEVLQLSKEFTEYKEFPTNAKMKKVTLNADKLAVLGLAETATPEDVEAKIGEVVQLNETLKGEKVELTEKLNSATTRAEDAEKKYNEQLAEVAKNKVIALVDEAVKDRKIVEGDRAHYVKLATVDYDTTKTVLDGMQGAEKVANLAKTGGDATEVDELLKLTYDELDKSGKAERLKELDPEAFKAVYKKRFGTDYQ